MIFLAQGEHGHHGFDVPVVVGPMALRIALLIAVFAVTGFALLRAFLGAPGRATSIAVTVSAAVAVLLEFMLAGALDIPSQAAVLVLATLAVPLVLAVSRDPGSPAARHARRAAPWVLTLAAVLAFVEFARAVLGDGTPMLLHTGLVLAIAGLSWLTIGVPRSRSASAAVQILAAALATAAIAGAGFAITLRQPDRPPVSSSQGGEKGEQDKANRQTPMLDRPGDRPHQAVQPVPPVLDGFSMRGHQAPPYFN
jgi:hypothetical protein